jgi:hypothetical protein
MSKDEMLLVVDVVDGLRLLVTKEAVHGCR